MTRNSRAREVLCIASNDGKIKNAGPEARHLTILLVLKLLFPFQSCINNMTTFQYDLLGV